MEDTLWWKTTVDGRWPLVEDDFWWKTTFYERRPLMENNLLWKTTFDGRQPLAEDTLWWRTTFDDNLCFLSCYEIYITSKVKTCKTHVQFIILVHSSSLIPVVCSWSVPQPEAFSRSSSSWSVRALWSGASYLHWGEDSKPCVRRLSQLCFTSFQCLEVHNFSTWFLAIRVMFKP